MRQATRRLLRNARPTLEGLEGRMLLSAKAAAAGPSLTDNRLSYTTPQGSRVVVTLLGAGSLAGSSVGSDGALNLTFSGTNASTGIVAHVRGGTGHAPLQSVVGQGLNPLDLSGIGSSVVNVVNLKGFDLVDNGRINLTGGVHTLVLNSVGSNTQINLRQLPPTFDTSGGGTTATIDGQTLQYASLSNGGLVLSGVQGQFVAGPNKVEPKTTVGFGDSVAVNPGPPPAPPGIILAVDRVNGVPRNPAVVGDPQVFGYDPTANALIRFDTSTGAALQSISLASMGGTITGVALGRNGSELVALATNGTLVRAFDATTGAAVGQFTTTNLASLGLGTVDGMGSTDSQTVVTDTSAPGGGLAVALDVTSSLASGQAVAAGQAFSPNSQFQLSGNLTGLPASHTVYATGVAFFNSFQPFATQFGILDLSVANGRIQSGGQSAVLSKGAYMNATAAEVANLGVGSVDQSLAVVTGVTNGANTVSLLNPQSLSSQGTFTLNDANLLTDLTESFRPNLTGSALIDVQGDVQSFRGTSARGLVLNDSGNLNLVKFARMSDSVIVGEPFSHAEIARRTNVSILSTTRTGGGRNGVTVVPGLRQLGPLSLPS